MKTTLISLFLLVLISCNNDGYWTYEWEQGFEEFQPSETIMDSLNIKAGMTVAEIGAGNGRLTVKIANRLKDSGFVFANDIDQKAVLFMNKRVKKENINNLTIVLGTTVDPKLPYEKFDLIYLINTYEYLEEPVSLLKNIIPSLKEDGILVVIATDPEKTNFAQLNSVNWQTIMRQAKNAGFESVKIQTFLPRDNIYFFKPKIVN